jgi:hypothetical protein
VAGVPEELLNAGCLAIGYSFPSAVPIPVKQELCQTVPLPTATRTVRFNGLACSTSGIRLAWQHGVTRDGDHTTGGEEL